MRKDCPLSRPTAAVGLAAIAAAARLTSGGPSAAGAAGGIIIMMIKPSVVIPRMSGGRPGPGPGGQSSLL